ncbi:ABC transporter family substrate-binding protein [Lipingzhangella sp. LS1_29]|uniref:ABC transporter family substrate-binding protein n=1 Tax=Lipingzhangella rawalii TaxID=2055835 RepID=A0ABU2H390_9ACTN|nr:ABC transporter family substrate-binding protein [Lipingzhangella rawalii]MDS1269768.1 ABC transporter family substrate-binding protein [Lipingzhangella rawalii]
MRTRRGITGLTALGAAGALLVAAACAPGDPEEDTADGAPGLEGCAENPNECNSGEAADGGDITWVVNAQPGAWSSQSAAGGSVYTLQMLEGVIPFTGRFLPDGETYEYNMDLLAEEPELRDEDADQYEVDWAIAEDAVWNDGTPITYRDFEVSWMMASNDEELCQGCAARSTASTEIIEDISSDDDDDKTFTVTYEDQYPEWFGLFSQHAVGGGFYPAHVAEEEGFDLDDPEDVGEYFEWLDSNRPEYSGGPFEITDGDLENQVVKQPNENYYGEAANLDTIVVDFHDDEGGWVPALANDEIHGASPAQINTDVIEELEGMDGVDMDIAPGPAWEHVDINFDVPEFQDETLRRAMFTAIDVEDIVNRNFGDIFPEAEPKTNLSFFNDSEYHEDHVSETGHGSGDAEAALEMLEDEGYELDGDTLTLDGDEIGPFTLRSTSTDIRDTSMELIQAHLNEIGIEIQIEPTEDLGETLAEGDYDLMQFGWNTNPFFTAAPQQQWHSDSPSNFGGYANDEVDELTEAVATAPDLDTAAERANEAAQIVTEEAYILPLLEQPDYVFVSEEYVNIRDHLASSSRASYNVGEWGVLAE